MTPETAAAAPPSPWLTVAEARARAKCGPRTIYRAIRAGRLKAVQLTRRRELRIRQDWLDAWMEAAAVVLNPHAPGGPVAVAPLRQRGAHL